MLKFNTDGAPGKVPTVKPRFRVENGCLVMSVNIDELVDAAQPSSTGKSEGVMLNLQTEFEHVTEIEGTKYVVRLGVSAGQTGSTWYSIKPIGKPIPVQATSAGKPIEPVAATK